MSENLPTDYPRLLEDIKERIRAAQVKANLAANRELILLYWEIGHLLVERRESEGWGSGVIPRLARDLKNELPGVRGFSERNLKRMTQFFQEYPTLYSIGPQVVAQFQSAEYEEDINMPQAVAQLAEPEQANLQQLVAQLPWAHNILLIQKVKDLNQRVWYMRQIIQNGGNMNRFPKDFMFELTKKELNNWRCQFGTSNREKMGLRYKPMAFTEQGVAMFTPLNACPVECLPGEMRSSFNWCEAYSTGAKPV